MLGGLARAVAARCLCTSRSSDLPYEAAVKAAREFEEEAAKLFGERCELTAATAPLTCELHRLPNGPAALGGDGQVSY